MMGLVDKGLGSFHTTPKGHQIRESIPLHWSTLGEVVLSASATMGLIFAIWTR